VTPVVKVEQLSKSYGEILAVDGISLQINQGELFGLIGSDGAGKTTTIRMLTGVLDATSGNATILDHPCSNLEGIREEIGYMSQRFGLYPDLTVSENIHFYAEIFGVPRDKEKQRTDQLLSATNLSEFRSRKAGNLSGGMKQKLGLACALIHTPKVLFLDEPTNGVDPLSRREFWKILHDLLVEGVTILVATAYLDEANRCHRVGLIHKGKLLACDTPENLRCIQKTGIEASLEDVFVSIIGNDGSFATENTLPVAAPHSEKIGTKAVSITGLTRRFGDFVAVDGIDLEVAQGEIFGFLGPNGAGKSTTIKMLCGILKPTGGSGSVAGCNIRTESEEIKKRIGYMSQKFSLYEDLTVEENIAFYGGIYRIGGRKLVERGDWAVRMAGLEERRNSLAGELSGGWKQRLALGCALLHEPPVIFLDEPTAGVDPISRRAFWGLIKCLAESGVTVFVTTHYMDEAEYCDRLAMIHQGEMIAIGTPQELKKEKMREGVMPSLEELFISLIEAKERRHPQQGI
jgi:ABC-2 type transport system ATP-binding protein